MCQLRLQVWPPSAFQGLQALQSAEKSLKPALDYPHPQLREGTNW